MFAKVSDPSSQFVDVPDLGSSSFAFNSQYLNRDQLRNTIESILPQLQATDFDLLKSSDPLKHQAIVNSATTLALVSLGIKPLACLPNEIAPLHTKIAEDLGVGVVSVMLPYCRAGIERHHIYNPTAVFSLFDKYQEFKDLNSGSLVDAISEVMRRPQISRADSSFHTCLGLLYGYPLQSIAHFVNSHSSNTWFEPIRNILDGYTPENVAKDTYDYIFNEQIPLKDRRSCIEEICLTKHNRAHVLALFDQEVLERTFGVGEFIWRDLKTSAASQEKVQVMVEVLSNLGLPYYLAEGKIGELSFVRPKN